MPSLCRRFRFSIRALLTVVALVATYFGSWPLCKDTAISDVQEYSNRNSTTLYIADSEPSVPFVVATHETAFLLKLTGTQKQRYYFWFFGFVAKLPYEREAQTGIVHASASSIDSEQPVLLTG